MRRVSSPASLQDNSGRLQTHCVPEPGYREVAQDRSRAEVERRCGRRAPSPAPLLTQAQRHTAMPLVGVPSLPGVCRGFCALGRAGEWPVLASLSGCCQECHGHGRGR